LVTLLLLLPWTPSVTVFCPIWPELRVGKTLLPLNYGQLVLINV
jgi:hypothetical protein